MTRTYDLKLLDLEPGEHEIMVVASGTGYIDSEPSDPLSYTES